MNLLENNNKEQLEKIGIIAIKILNRFEIGLAIAAILSFTAMTQRIEFGNVFLIIILSLLSILYFFKAFAILDDPLATGIEIFLTKLYTWSLSIIMLGITFVMNRWPMWDTQLTIGVMTLFIVTIFIIFIKAKKPELKVFSSKTIYRAIIVLIIGAFLLFTPADKLSEIGIISPPDQVEQVDNN